MNDNACRIGAQINSDGGLAGRGVLIDEWQQWGDAICTGRHCGCITLFALATERFDTADNRTNALVPYGLRSGRFGSGEIRCGRGWCNALNWKRLQRHFWGSYSCRLRLRRLGQQKVTHT